MATSTSRLGLNKPEPTDFYDVTKDAENIQKIDDLVALKTKGDSSIPTTGWVADATTGYALKVDVTVAGIVATDNVNVFIDATKQLVAQAAELNPSGVSSANTITFFANVAPTETIPFSWEVVR